MSNQNVSRHNVSRRGFALALGSLLTCGCQNPVSPRFFPLPFSRFRQPEVVAPAARRVVVVPPQCERAFERGGDLLQQTLANELSATRAFDVALANRQQCGGFEHRQADGRFSFQMLSAMRKQHNADAVVFVRLREYRPYWPPRIGAAVDLVRTDNAQTIASVDGYWDARDQNVRDQITEYLGLISNEYGTHDIALHSPESFSRFVAHQIAAAVVKPNVTILPGDVNSLLGSGVSPVSWTSDDSDGLKLGNCLTGTCDSCPSCLATSGH